MLKSIKIMICYHPPREAGSKDVLKGVDRGCQAWIGQESLVVTITVVIIFDCLILLFLSQKVQLVKISEMQILMMKCLEVSSVSRGNKKTVEHPNTNL